MQCPQSRSWTYLCSVYFSLGHLRQRNSCVLFFLQCLQIILCSCICGLTALAGLCLPCGADLVPQWWLGTCSRAFQGHRVLCRRWQCGAQLPVCLHCHCDARHSDGQQGLQKTQVQCFRLDYTFWAGVSCSFFFLGGGEAKPFPKYWG